jgi:hypothetical protein
VFTQRSRCAHPKRLVDAEPRKPWFVSTGAEKGASSRNRKVRHPSVEN